MPGEFSIIHWLILFAILFLVFGAKRLPEVGSSMGKSIREFKKALSAQDEPESLPPASPADTAPASRGDRAAPKKLSE